MSKRTGQRERAFTGQLIDPDIPTPGSYRIKLAKGAPTSAVRIWLGHPIDPETGEEMTERGFRWQASINGEPVPLDRVWPGCARDPIDDAEHARIMERNSTQDDDSPFYDVRKPVDLSRAPPPF